jgi:hypothetical protein
MIIRIRYIQNIAVERQTLRAIKTGFAKSPSVIAAVPLPIVQQVFPQNQSRQYDYDLNRK